MWIMGNGFRGSSIKNLERVTNDGERIEIRGSAGIKFTNERTYREVRDFEPDGQTPLVPNTTQTYEHARDSYPNPNYADWIYPDTPTRQFSAIDNEAPYNKEFHYEITIYNDPNDPDDITVYKTDKCEFTAQPQEFFSPVPCSPIVFTDPLIIDRGDWVGLLSIDPLSYPGRRELFDIIGRRTPVAYSQVRQTARTTIRVITGILPNGIATPAAVRQALHERQEFLDLLSSGRILLMRNPDWRYPENDWYISVGEVTEERIFTDHRRPERRFVLEVAVVDRPDGYLNVVGNRTYGQARNFLPDGATDAPADYSYGDWIGPNGYLNYYDVVLGQEYFVPQVTGLVSRNLVYGEGIYPTKEAAVTSWSLH